MSAEEYLSYLHTQLVGSMGENNIPTNFFLSGCAVVAGDLAEQLLIEGKRPSILIFGYEDDREIWPPLYNNKVAGTKHIVCSYKNMVYDPMIGKPIHIKEYEQIAFGEKIPQAAQILDETLEEYIEFLKRYAIQDLDIY